jgi:hypothetical protein
MDGMTDLDLKNTNAIVDMTKAHEKLAKGFDETKIRLSEQREKIQEVIDVWGQFGSDMGTVFAEIIKGTKDIGEAFKEAIKGSIASVIEMFAKQWLALAVGELVPGFTFNPVAAAGHIAAATGAMIAAGAIRAMKEGGIVMQPTHALIGERGPEAVIPLKKMGNMGNPIYVTVYGSVLEEEGLARKIWSVASRQQRGW